MGTSVAEQNRNRKEFIKKNSPNTIFKIGGSHTGPSSGGKTEERPETHLGYTEGETYSLFSGFHEKICQKQSPGDECLAEACPAGFFGICNDLAITDDWKKVADFLVGEGYIEPTKGYMDNIAEKNRETHLEEIRKRYTEDSGSIHP